MVNPSGIPRLLEDFFNLMHEMIPDRRVLERMGLTLNDITRYQNVCALARALVSILTELLWTRSFNNDEVTTRFKEFLLLFMAELCLAFQEMRQHVKLSQQDMGRYDELISYMQPYLQHYNQILEGNNIPNAPANRVSYLDDFREELWVLINNYRGLGLSIRMIEAYTVLSTYAEVPRPEGHGQSPVMCPICLFTIQQHNYVRQLRCMHIFHSQCIEMSLRLSVLCPMCRRDVTRRE